MIKDTNRVGLGRNDFFMVIMCVVFKTMCVCVCLWWKVSRHAYIVEVAKIIK